MMAARQVPVGIDRITQVKLFKCVFSALVAIVELQVVPYLKQTWCSQGCSTNSVVTDLLMISEMPPRPKDFIVA